MIIYSNEDSSNVVFSYNEVGILSIDLNNTNLYNNDDEDDPGTTILIRLLAWHIRFEKRKELKKKISEELMPKGGILKDAGIFECHKMRKKK